MSSSTRTSYLVQLVTVLNNFIAILFLRSAIKNRFNKAYISTRFSPNPRHVLPDEVAVSLGQGQGGGGQGSACFKKSFHRFLWFSFFILVFEPLVFRLFLLLASVIFTRTYILSRSFMKVNEFHYSFPLILCVLYTELVFFLFSFQLPNKSKDDKPVFTYAPPSTTVVSQQKLMTYLKLKAPPGFSQSSRFIVVWIVKREASYPGGCLPTPA